jgi:hypothetical protein
MIKCTFCSLVDDGCDICDGFGWFIPDEPEKSKPTLQGLEGTIGQNPIGAIHSLKKWFEKSASDLSEETGSYVFYEDIAESLAECEHHLLRLAEYEEKMCGDV